MIPNMEDEQYKKIFKKDFSTMPSDDNAQGEKREKNPRDDVVYKDRRPVEDEDGNGKDPSTLHPKPSQPSLLTGPLSANWDLISKKEADSGLKDWTKMDPDPLERAVGKFAENGKPPGSFTPAMTEQEKRNEEDSEEIRKAGSPLAMAKDWVKKTWEGKGEEPKGL